jgi:hypothetical protein
MTFNNKRQTTKLLINEKISPGITHPLTDFFLREEKESDLR